MSGEVDDLSTVINIQYAGVAIREANFSACGDYATPQKKQVMCRNRITRRVYI